MRRVFGLIPCSSGFRVFPWLLKRQRRRLQLRRRPNKLDAAQNAVGRSRSPRRMAGHRAHPHAAAGEHGHALGTHRRRIRAAGKAILEGSPKRTAKKFAKSDCNVTINPPSYWQERGKPDRQASLVVDPPDGRIPPLTPEGAGGGSGPARRTGARQPLPR